MVSFRVLFAAFAVFACCTVLVSAQDATPQSNMLQMLEQMAKQQEAELAKIESERGNVHNEAHIQATSVSSSAPSSSPVMVETSTQSTVSTTASTETETESLLTAEQHATLAAAQKRIQELQASMEKPHTETAVQAPTPLESSAAAEQALQHVQQHLTNPQAFIERIAPVQQDETPADEAAFEPQQVNDADLSNVLPEPSTQHTVENVPTVASAAENVARLEALLQETLTKSEQQVHTVGADVDYMNGLADQLRSKKLAVVQQRLELSNDELQLARLSELIHTNEQTLAKNEEDLRAASDNYLTAVTQYADHVTGTIHEQAEAEAADARAIATGTEDHSDHHSHVDSSFHGESSEIAEEIPVQTEGSEGDYVEYEEVPVDDNGNALDQYPTEDEAAQQEEAVSQDFVEYDENGNPIVHSTEAEIVDEVPSELEAGNGEVPVDAEGNELDAYPVEEPSEVAYEEGDQVVEEEIPVDENGIVQDHYVPTEEEQQSEEVVDEQSAEQYPEGEQVEYEEVPVDESGNALDQYPTEDEAAEMHGEEIQQEVDENGNPIEVVEEVPGEEYPAEEIPTEDVGADQYPTEEEVPAELGGVQEEVADVDAVQEFVADTDDASAEQYQSNDALPNGGSDNILDNIPTIEEQQAELEASREGLPAFLEQRSSGKFGRLAAQLREEY